MLITLNVLDLLDVKSISVTIPRGTDTLHKANSPSYFPVDPSLMDFQNSEV